MKKTKKVNRKPKVARQEKPVVIPTAPVKDRIKSANANQDRVTAYVKG